MQMRSYHNQITSENRNKCWFWINETSNWWEWKKGAEIWENKSKTMSRATNKHQKSLSFPATYSLWNMKNDYCFLKVFFVFKGKEGHSKSTTSKITSWYSFNIFDVGRDTKKNTHTNSIEEIREKHLYLCIAYS